jgi:hypothetical protein
MTHQDRPAERRGREAENENLRAPDQAGQPPRPATEPRGSKASGLSTETRTDPGSGEPNPRHKDNR